MSDRQAFRHRAADRLSTWIVGSPVAVLVAAMVLAVIAVAWSWNRVRLDANTDSLMGQDRPYVAEYLRFIKEFGDLEYAWVVVDAADANGNIHLGQAQHAVDLIDARLRQEPSIERVNARITVPEQMRLATWGMKSQELAALVEGRDALPILAGNTGTGSLLADARRRLDRLTSQGLFMPREQAEREGAAAFLELAAIASAAPDAPEFFGTPRETRYLMSESGRLLFISVMPRKDFSRFEVIDQPLAAIRAVIADVHAQVPEVSIGLTGKPVLQADEMATTNADMNISSIVGLVLCTALFMAVFRGVKLPLLALFAFLIGCALTYAAAALIYGRLNLLSIVFMLVLVGVGLDYGIHMVARYLEARRHLPTLPSVQHMMRTAVPSNLSGALTSAGVFLLAWFTEFQGLRELGVVSGVGLLLTFASIVVVLPALLVIFDHRLKRDEQAVPANSAFFTQREGVDRGIRSDAAWRSVAISGVVAIVAAWYGFNHLQFESNLLNLQAKGLDSVAWERRVIDDSAAASWFGACIVKSMEQITPLADRLRSHPEVGQVRSVLDAVQLETPERAALRTQFANAVEAAAVRPRRATEWSGEGIRAAADRLESLSGFAEKESIDAATQMRTLAARLKTVATMVTAGDQTRLDPQEETSARQAVTDAVHRTQVALLAMAEGARRDLRGALPEAIRAQMLSPNGKFLLMVHPVGDVWEEEPLEKFVSAIRAEDPQATGAPMTVSESTKSMERSFLQQAILATLMVSILLWIDLRNIRETAAALLSLVIGVTWTVGLMAACGTSFNLANFFAIPIMIGLGIDSAIHITHRAHEGALNHGFGSTRRAVTVTALTTTIGFGALILAHHQGLRSLGIAMAVGSACCLVTAVWTLPALLKVMRFTAKNHGLRLVPVDANADSSKDSVRGAA